MRRRPLVAISVADAPGQAELGHGKEHVIEAFVRIARLLLRRGCGLAFGGDLRPGGYTEILLRLVRAENSSLDADGAANQPRSSRELRRMVDYLSWPRYGDLTPDRQARYLGVCRFVRVPPPRGSKDGAHAEASSVAHRLRTSLSMSAMRRAMAFGGVPDVDGKNVPPATARLVLGGKLEQYSGLIPGIAEEVAWALTAATPRQPVPVFVLGGFGGAAAALARGFRERELPEELTLDWHCKRDETLAERLRLLDADPRLAREYHPRLRYEALARACARGVTGLARINGASRRDNERLLASNDLTEVLGVLSRMESLGKPAPAD